MKYAIKFYQGCPILDKADEIIIKYDKRNVNLIDFVKKQKENIRVVINAAALEDLEPSLDIFAAALAVHPASAVIVTHRHNYSLLADKGIPFFFIEGVRTFDDFQAQIALGVSDMYILNEMGFFLGDIAKYCKANNIIVRAYPNVAQSSSVFKTDSIRQFFIRPEDIGVYEEYVDVLEFFGPLDKQPILYKIYNNKEWNGELQHLILGLREEVDNRTIMPLFGRCRSVCEKRCSYNRCNLCTQAYAIGNHLKEKNLCFEKNKELLDGYRTDENVGENESAEAITNTP